MVEEVVGSGMRKSEVNRNEKINIYSGERLLSGRIPNKRKPAFANSNICPEASALEHVGG